jgi:hypothetical protein
MSRVPSAIWVIDTKKEHIAVGEARKLGIPVVAILDTNCDPDEVDYKIPGNDDAIRSAALLTRVVADAVAEGLMTRANATANAGRDGAEADKPEPTGQLGADEPLPGVGAQPAGQRWPVGRRPGRGDGRGEQRHGRQHGRGADLLTSGTRSAAPGDAGRRGPA